MSIDIERLRLLCAKGLDRVQIAHRMGVTHNAVLKACKRYGIAVVAVKSYGSAVNFSAKNVCALIEKS